MNQRSRSTLFLIEQLIVVAVFAICAAACVKILASAFLTARESKDVSGAVLIAQSAVESYKSVAGDIGKVAQLLGGTSENVGNGIALTVYYDKQWQVCGKDDANYIMRLTNSQPEASTPHLLSGELLVEKLTGEELVAFPVAAMSR